MKKNNKNYNDEHFINDLVDRYKETPSPDLLNQLISSFTPYFKKYVSMLCSRNSINIHNADTLKFLRLLMNKEERENDITVKFAAIRAVKYLRKVFSCYEKEEVFNEMLIIFLQALKKYKMMIADHKRSRERISFTHYIQVQTKFKLFKVVKDITKDALSNNNVPFNDGIISRSIDYSSLTWKPIDLRWVHGYTTGEEFVHLTKIERYLLWLKYASGYKGKVLSSVNISSKTGLHYKTIQYRLNNIRKKLIQAS